MPSPSRRRALPVADPRLKRIETLGYWLDNAIPIPGTRFRIGFDAIIGLIPGVGDAVGTALSAYIVLEAARFGVPVRTLLRMVYNVALEAVVGTVPFLGDVFDAGWKANRKNLDLLEAHLNRKGARPPSNRRVVVLLAGALLILLVLLVVLLVFLGGLAVDLLRG